jgi:hypothetical protein
MENSLPIIFGIVGFMIGVFIMAIVGAGGSADDALSDYAIQIYGRKNSELEKELDWERHGFDKLYESYKTVVFEKKIIEENLEIAYSLIEYQIEQLEPRKISAKVSE